MFKYLPAFIFPFLSIYQRSGADFKQLFFINLTLGMAVAAVPFFLALDSRKIKILDGLIVAFIIAINFYQYQKFSEIQDINEFKATIVFGLFIANTATIFILLFKHLSNKTIALQTRFNQFFLSVLAPSIITVIAFFAL